MIRLVIFAAAMLASALAFAADLSDPDYRTQVAKQFPGVEADDISPSAIDGLWEISQGGAVGYVSADGRYLFEGDLIDLQRNVNMTEQRRREWRLQRIADVDESDMLIFSPPDPKHTLTVFTDIKCPYCQRLHQQIDKLMAAGVRVRYLFYPLAGPDSKAYKQAAAVWCSEDRRAALNAALRGQPVPGKPGCGAPIAAHYQLAVETLRLNGTPTIITDSGRILPPGLPVSALVKEVLAAN